MGRGLEEALAGALRRRAASSSPVRFISAWSPDRIEWTAKAISFLAHVSRGTLASSSSFRLALGALEPFFVERGFVSARCPRRFDFRSPPEFRCFYSTLQPSTEQSLQQTPHSTWLPSFRDFPRNSWRTRQWFGRGERGMSKA